MLNKTILTGKVSGKEISIKEGEKVLLYGHNGAGKTTIVKKMLQIQKNDIFALECKNVLFVPETLHINPNINITVSQLSEISMVEKKLFDADKFLQSVKNSNLKDLSSGQQKLVWIKISALKNSELKVFDEPFSNLDQDNADAVLEILQKEKSACIIVLHEIPKSMQFNQIIEILGNENI